MKKVIIATLMGVSLLLLGCGSGSSESKYELSAGESFEVKSADVIQQSNDGRITIEHSAEDDSKIVTVLSGTVTVIRKN